MLVTSTQHLFAHRPSVIGRMLRPLKGAVVPCHAHEKTVNQGKILAAHDGGLRADMDYHLWRFRTLSRQLECQYFELWKFSTDEREAYLRKAYLHLYWIDRTKRESKRILSLHAELDNEENADALDWRSFHMHVDGATQPIPKCHFPLTISHDQGHTAAVISSIDNLTAVLCSAAQALRIEVVDRYLKLDAER